MENLGNFYRPLDSHLIGCRGIGIIDLCPSMVAIHAPIEIAIDSLFSLRPSLYIRNNTYGQILTHLQGRFSKNDFVLLQFKGHPWTLVSGRGGEGLSTDDKAKLSELADADVVFTFLHDSNYMGRYEMYRHGACVEYVDVPDGGEEYTTGPGFQIPEYWSDLPGLALIEELIIDCDLYVPEISKHAYMATGNSVKLEFSGLTKDDLEGFCFLGEPSYQLLEKEESRLFKEDKTASEQRASSPTNRLAQRIDFKRVISKGNEAPSRDE